MHLLHWHHAFNLITNLDDISSHWHQAAQDHHLNPGYETPAYFDAILSFIATSPLAASLKLGAVLTCVSGLDFDLRLALGALEETLDEEAVAWPTPFDDVAAPLGPCVPLVTADSQVSNFALGRLAGLRDTLHNDGKSLTDWRAAFWSAYFELACRWADCEALELAFRHGATVDQPSPAALEVIAEGAHSHALRTPYYTDGRTDDDYVAVLDRLCAIGPDVMQMSEIMLPAAAAVNNTTMLEHLVSRGADLAATGQRALIAAASGFAHDAVQWLLARGVDVRASEDAALVGAVAALDEPMVVTLLKAGADVHAADEEPLCMACRTLPEDLYNGADGFIEARADMLVLLVRHSANARHAAVTAALQHAEDGEVVLSKALLREELAESHRRDIQAAGEAAFGWTSP